MTYEFFTDIFKYERFPVEYECYKQLKHSDDLNYVAIPWTQILNSHWLNFPGRQHRDFYLKQLSKECIDQRDNFTVCQHDSYMLLSDYFKHLNITKVFACAAYDYDVIDGIEIIPMPYINTFNFNNEKKDILVSFIGSVTHECRNVIKSRIRNEYIIFRDSYHITPEFFSEKEKTQNEHEKHYRDVLSRSRFSLCPRGSNPNSVRFWESLAAGAIPVLFSDNYKLPKWDWENTIIQLSESSLSNMDYQQLQDILSSIPDEDAKRENCLKAYDSFKHENYKSYIVSNL